MHSDAFLFIQSLWAYWFLLVSGLGSLLVGVVERVRQKNLEAYLLGGLALILLFLACFFAWQDEHDAREKVEAKFAELTQPKFEVTIREVGACEPCWTQKPPERLFGILTDVSDDGASSYISDVEVDLKLADGRKFPNLRPFYPKVKRDGKIEPMDTVVARYNQNPIPSHSRPRGWVYFIAPDISLGDFFAKGTTFTLRIWDYQNKEYDGTYFFSGGQETNHLYYPGGDIQ
jgi:hypothetical protein